MISRYLAIARKSVYMPVPNIKLFYGTLVQAIGASFFSMIVPFQNDHLPADCAAGLGRAAGGGSGAREAAAAQILTAPQVTLKIF